MGAATGRKKWIGPWKLLAGQWTRYYQGNEGVIMIYKGPRVP